jgi:hypothetical protein
MHCVEALTFQAWPKPIQRREDCSRCTTESRGVVARRALLVKIEHGHDGSHSCAPHHSLTFLPRPCLVLHVPLHNVLGPLIRQAGDTWSRTTNTRGPAATYASRSRIDRTPGASRESLLKSSNGAQLSGGQATATLVCSHPLFRATRSVYFTSFGLFSDSSGSFGHRSG